MSTPSSLTYIHSLSQVSILKIVICTLSVLCFGILNVFSAEAPTPKTSNPPINEVSPHFPTVTPPLLFFSIHPSISLNSFSKKDYSNKVKVSKDWHLPSYRKEPLMQTLQSLSVGPTHCSQFLAHKATKRTKSLTPKDCLLAGYFRSVVKAISSSVPVWSTSTSALTKRSFAKPFDPHILL